MTRALLLNASYEPHQIIPDRKMVRLYMDEKVEVVEYSGREFRSANYSVLIPSVARLIQYVIMPEKHRSVLLTTKAVLARDSHICSYCDGVADTMDHIEPRAHGGKHVWENVTASCRKCNQVKADLTLAQLLEMGPDKPKKPGEIEKWLERWTLHRVPHRPRGIDAWLMTMKPDPAWNEWLNVA